MPGTITFKTIEANLSHNTEFFGKMSPYCNFMIGQEKIQGQVCIKGGKHPHWNDSVIIPVENEPTVVVEVMDKDRITNDDQVGDCTIDLQEIELRGQVRRWYPLTHKNKPAGEILIESTYESAPTEPIIKTVAPATTISQTLHQDLSHQHGGHVYIEQRQSVEPHTFTKSVQVVETRPVMKEIEVLEPHKVLKDVQYTEAVPVHKQIEVVEPYVVTKEVEVIEPRLVTKEIQVVENVSVKKYVDVIEPRTTIKEVDSFEPQTFTRQMEVTEQVPVRKQVTVTEPYTVTRTVDFVEPVITTKTITREVREPVIVDEKVTQSVGPATVVGIEQQTYVNKFGEMNLSEEQRIVEQQRWAEEQRRLEQERRWEQERLQQGNLGSQTAGYSYSTYQPTAQMGTSGMETGKYSSTNQTGQQMGTPGMETGTYSSTSQTGQQIGTPGMETGNYPSTSQTSQQKSKFAPTYGSGHKKF